MVKIYDYPYSENHSRNDTDGFIMQSVEKYCCEKGMNDSSVMFVKRTSLGKPFVEGRRGIYVSVTHAGRLLLVAVADKEVGIDCESLSRRVRDTKALALRFFTPAEKEELAKTPDEQKDLHFLKLWVAKEALVKLSGEGLAAITKTDSVFASQNIEVRYIDDYRGYITAVALKKS